MLHSSSHHCTCYTVHHITVHATQFITSLYTLHSSSHHCTCYTVHHITVHATQFITSLYTLHSSSHHCTCYTVHHITVHATQFITRLGPQCWPSSGYCHTRNTYSNLVTTVKFKDDIFLYGFSLRTRDNDLYTSCLLLRRIYYWLSKYFRLFLF